MQEIKKLEHMFTQTVETERGTYSVLISFEVRGTSDGEFGIYMVVDDENGSIYNSNDDDDGQLRASAARYKEVLCQLGIDYEEFDLVLEEMERRAHSVTAMTV